MWSDVIVCLFYHFFEKKKNLKLAFMIDVMINFVF